MPDFLYMLFVSFVYVKMIVVSDIFQLLCSVKILYSIFCLYFSLICFPYDFV